MGVSRPSLREALQKLSARGMLVARRGGGTTVTNSLNPALEDPLLELISNSPDSHADVLELRHAISLLRKSIRYNLENVYAQTGRFEHVRDQHYHLMTAIINGDPDNARSASDRHIDYVERVLIDTDSQRQREARASRRALGATTL